MNEENKIINDDMGINIVDTSYNGERIRRAYGNFPWPNDQEINGIEPRDEDDLQPEPEPEPTPEDPLLKTVLIDAGNNTILIELQQGLDEYWTDIMALYNDSVIADSFTELSNLQRKFFNSTLKTDMSSFAGSMIKVYVVFSHPNGLSTTKTVYAMVSGQQPEPDPDSDDPE